MRSKYVVVRERGGGEERVEGGGSFLGSVNELCTKSRMEDIADRS